MRMRKFKKSWPLLLATLIATLLAAAALPRAASAQIAVIVHPSTPLSNVSVEELRRYFLGKTGRIGTAEVQVVESTKDRGAFYRALVSLSEDEVRRRWVGLAFRGEIAHMPKEFADAAELRRFVSEHPGTIAFIAAHAVDASVKVLAVGGRQPSDAGYPLR